MSTHSIPHKHPHFRPPDNRTRRNLVGLTIAVLGGAIALWLALLIGAVHTTAPATTVVETAPVSTAASQAGGTWATVYPEANAGEVDITVQMTTTVNSPFGARSEQETATAAGFVLNGNGDVVTAAHVVDGATSINVTFDNGTTRNATVLGKDDASDVAVIHVNPAGLTLHPLRLGSSKELAVGDSIAVLGDPLGFDRSLSTGVVSALDRTIQAPNGFEIAHSIQTDAAMNPGNSGGPLLNTSGQVIGIADQIATGTNQFGGASSSDASTGVGFAVPIDLIKAELVPLEHGQTVAHAYLGISTSETSNGSPGALVASVQSGTPAAKAGLKDGDVIVAVNGAAVDTEGDLIDALAAAKPGDRVKLTVERGSSRITLIVTLGTQPSQAPSQQGPDATDDTDARHKLRATPVAPANVASGCRPLCRGLARRRNRAGTLTALTRYTSVGRHGPRAGRPVCRAGAEYRPAE
jgi:putative serine protease PepD